MFSDTSSRPSRLKTKRKDGDKMTLDEYGEWAATIPKPEHPSREQRLAYLGLGLAGEAGEVADTLRRGMREGTLNEDRLAYELADLLFHWVSLCAELGLQPSALIAAGRAHIEERVAARSVA
jgi:NTP pyrophosphatase (non-canonical NTP hydrolase)